MNANEIRIGNWIYDEVKDKPIQATAHHINQLAIAPDYRCSPIPLHEHWLHGFDFEDDGFDNDCLQLVMITLMEMNIGLQVMPQYKAIIRKDGRTSVFGRDHCSNRWRYLGWCEFVHEFQNLYFAIERQEVKTKQEVSV